MANVKKGKTEIGAQPGPGPIEARIVSFPEGLRVYPDVQLVRIKSKTYTLLIMRDYLPTLGEIEGDVTLLTPQGEIALHKIEGYYIHKANVFSLMIEEKAHA